MKNYRVLLGDAGSYEEILVTADDWVTGTDWVQFYNESGSTIWSFPTDNVYYIERVDKHG